MRKIYTRSNGTSRGIITKADARKAIRATFLNANDIQVESMLPKIPGQTRPIVEGVDLVKVRNPSGGAIKYLFALVGCKSTIEKFASALG